jgi:AraC-like DNA-binding protein
MMEVFAVMRVPRMRIGKLEAPAMVRVKKPARACIRRRLPVDSIASGDAADASVVCLGIAAEVATVLQNFGVGLDDEIRLACRALPESVRPSRPLPVAELGTLISLCVARTTCSHFGLLVGQQGVLASLGVVGALVPRSQPAGRILKNLVRRLQRADATTAPKLTQHGDVARLSYPINQPEVENSDQIVDGAIATGLGVLRVLFGSEWSPSAVLLPRAPPADLTPFTRFFGANVSFDAGTAALIFPASDLEQMITSGAILRRLFADRLWAPRNGAADSFGDDVRRVLRARLPRENCSVEAIAAMFSMHPRTFSRRLRHEGLALSTMVDEIRFAIACRLLSQTGMTITQAARVLGFAETSVFTRAFRRWSGQTPTAWLRRGGQ